MTRLKDLFLEIEDQSPAHDENGVEVYADSIKQALELASAELNVDVSSLDYEILEKGTRGFFGIGRLPYRILVVPMAAEPEHIDITDIEKKLAGEHVPHLTKTEPDNMNGTFRIRVTKTGVWLTVKPPRGKGKKADLMEVNNKLFSLKITNADTAKVDTVVRNSDGEPVRIGDWIPNPAYDSTMRVEVTDDEMNAFVHFTPPKYFGRHFEIEEVLERLKSEDVVYGIQEKEIRDYLDEMNYNAPLTAARGLKQRNGKDAYVDYKVKVDKTGVKFEEDESGKVDFRNVELLENVVVGQLLCVKVPAEAGIEGRTVTNKILSAKSGKDTKILHGKGTILSEDGSELTAEINGQVVFKLGKVTVEPIFMVNGDVSLETGNIVFLGSVVVSGSVQDNFVVKAAGNVEVKGTVQKAFIEAEGDIIVHQGISGREEAKIESTGGSVFAKFVQGANVVAEKDVIVPEGILHSRVDAGNRIYSIGKRAKIVGGIIRAGNEVNARYLGAEVSTTTEIRVGINPKVLQQIADLEGAKNKTDDELKKVQLDLKTLTTLKKTSRLSEEKEKMFEDLTARNEKLTARMSDVNIELEELNQYIGMLEHKGKICAEKKAYPGVVVYIKDQRFQVKDEYNYIKFTLEGDQIRLSEYEKPDVIDGQMKFGITGRRRGR